MLGAHSRGGGPTDASSIMAAALFALTILVVVYLFGMRRSN